MAGLFSRNAWNEIDLKIDLEILNINSQKMAVTDDIMVQWKPGKSISGSKKYSFIPDKFDQFAQPSKQIQVNERFSRISTFAYAKNKGDWRPQICDFKLIACKSNKLESDMKSKAESKVIAERKFDIAVCIGAMQDP